VSAVAPPSCDGLGQMSEPGPPPPFTTPVAGLSAQRNSEPLAQGRCAADILGPSGREGNRSDAPVDGNFNVVARRLGAFVAPIRAQQLVPRLRRSEQFLHAARLPQTCGESAPACKRVPSIAPKGHHGRTSGDGLIAVP
jgi:hypothetical protein